MILNQLGIFGWKEADENLVLASLLTGDPLLRPKVFYTSPMIKIGDLTVVTVVGSGAPTTTE